MQIPFLAEVVEAGNLTYNENPFSLLGKVLPAGSIRVRPLVNDRRGNVSLTYARPLTLSIGNIPLVGEHVLVFPGISIDESIGDFRATTYYYFPFALNATDDAVINQLPDYDFRKTSPEGGGGGGGGARGAVGGIVGGALSGAISGGVSGGVSGAIGGVKSVLNNLPILPGVTFPRPVRPIRPLQWYEGDSVFQNRSGSSLRLGSGTAQHPQYASQPDFHTSPDRGSPLFALVCDEPNGGKSRPLVEIPTVAKLLMNYPGLKKLSQKFRTEDPRRVKVGFYGGIGLQIANIIQARICYANPLKRLKVLGETLPVPSFRGSQIVSDSDRIVMNAKRDNIIGLARKRIILEASKIILITNEHTVDLDDLVNDVQKLATELVNLMTGMYPFATPVGPTGPNIAGLAIFKLISSKLNGLNSFPCLPPPPPPSVPPPEADFGVNVTSAPYGNFSLGGGTEPAGSAGSPSSSPPYTPDPSENGGSESTGSPGSTDGTPGVGTPTTLTGGSGTPLNGESGSPSTGTESTSPTGTGGTGGSGPGGSGSGGSGSGGGSTPPQKCQLLLHLVSDNQLGWGDSKLELYSKEVLIQEYILDNASTMHMITVDQGTALQFKYVAGTDDTVDSYVIASDSKILFSNGVCPDVTAVYDYECKPGSQPSASTTVITFGDQAGAETNVMYYELELVRVSKATLVRNTYKAVLALITAPGDMQGWYLVRGNPAKFKPSEQCLLSKNILADNVSLSRELQRVNLDDIFNYVDVRLQKIPYMLTLKV